MNIKKLYILLFLSFFFVQSIAQERCGSQLDYDSLMATDSEFAKNQEILEQATQEYLKNGILKSATNGIIYTIPVVVHVVHNSLTNSKYDSNIEDDQIQSMIDVLNNDFQFMNTDKDSVPDYFSDLRANIQIKFELAKRDPSGNSTNGITRDYREKAVYNDRLGDAKRSSTSGVDAWDTKSYLNIWTVPGFTNSEVLGASTFPGEPIRQVSGIVIKHNFVGVDGIGSAISDGRVATHEVGHYLNLKHIWGNPLIGIDNCSDGDGVYDTPNQFGSHVVGGCPKGILKSCSNEPYGDMYMNYMDYTKCRYMFTEGQKKRMHKAMEDPSRNTLVSINNLALVSPRADLILITPDVLPTSVIAGNSITIYFEEYNMGSSLALPNFVNLYLSRDNILTLDLQDDRYLDQCFVDQVIIWRFPTMEYSKEITIPKDVTPGIYYLFFAADGTGLVTESDKSNNFAYLKIEVTANTALKPPLNLKAVAGDEQVTLTWQAPSSGSPNSYNIYRSATENVTYTKIGTDVKTTTLKIPGLSNGTTYWFYVDAIYASGEKAASTKVNAKPFTTIKLPNDDCSGAKSLVSSGSCNYLENQTVNNATASGKPKGSCDTYTGTPDLADVWYYFKAQSTSHTITVDPNGSQLDAVIVAYSNCTSSTAINCSDIAGLPGIISTLNLTGLVIGNTYYIRVYDFGKQTTMGDFRICVSGESSANSCTIASLIPNTITHGQAGFSTTSGLDDIKFTAQPNCSFEITNYCSWLTVSPMSGTTDNNGQASVNYSIEANNTTITREGIFYINGSTVTITQDGEDATDDDNDGIINSMDLCPNTPVGEVIDANGCSSSQVFSEIKNLQYNDVVLNTPQDRTIGLFNEDTTEFSITNISISGANADQFSISPIPPFVVLPDTFLNLTVTFNPTSIGAKLATIVITTNALHIPTKTITLNGNGVDYASKVMVSIPATTYDYGDVKRATSQNKTFIIQNTGSNALTISDIAIEGLNPEPYSITYAPTVPFDISPGLTEPVTIKFTPTSLGSKSALLVISNNSDNLSPKHSIGILGNGTENYYVESINNLNALEYWFDDQYQAKVNTPATLLFDSDLGGQVVTEGLEPGLHKINIRYQDDKGKWSSIVSDFFHKLPETPNGSPKITASEYWFDDNFADKVSTAITPGQRVTTSDGFDVSSLTNGLHIYHVRYKDDAGQWSSVVSEFFQKLPVSSSDSRNIIASEYWFDNDFAGKVYAELSPGQNISNSGGFEVSNLKSGLHSYHVRYKDDSGQWSSVVTDFFQKLPITAAGSRTITASEYWFDDNFADKVSEAITPGQTITSNEGFDVSSLTNGMHIYHVRYKDNAGQWSSVVSEFFQKVAVNIAVDNLITAYRYWFNSDLTNTKTIQLPVPVNPYDLNGNISTSSLSVGKHKINLQFKDSLQAWSSVVTDTFTIDVSTMLVQDIVFTTGWNIFSASLTPENPELENIFQPLVDKGSLVKIQDEKGNSLENWEIFGGWKNNIGNLVPSEGYKVKVNIDDSITLFGKKVSYPFSIPLKTGWNIIGYPQQINFDGTNIIQQLINKGKLIKVQDENGNSIEDWGIFGSWKNNIGNFLPGEGYKVKVSADDTLWIAESYPKSTVIQPEIVVPKYFTPQFKGNGIDHMNINLVDLPFNLMQAGDELAVFDGATCVGAVTLMPHHLRSQVVSITASATDNQGTPGFFEGNPFILKFWNVIQNREFNLEPEILNGIVIFMKHETTVASLEKYSATGLEGIAGSINAEFNCYPNPFSEEVTIEINLSTETKVSIEILNQLGQQVKTLAAGERLDMGIHRLIWDGTNTVNSSATSGIYIIRLKIDNTVHYRKVIYSK